MTIAIAAAGTAGHVQPALSIAEAMVDLGWDRCDILFLGGRRHAATAVPAAGFDFTGFELVKLDRTLALRHLKIPLVVRRTAAAMEHTLRERGIKVVLGMAGYVTVPAAMAARRCRLPLYLQEQNASPGLAARYAARRAERTFLGLPGAAERLPRSEVLGNPLRPELAAFDRDALRDEALSYYDVAPGTKVLGVLGGSLGARVLNQSLESLAAGWSGDPITIVHLAGRTAAEEMQGLAAASALPWRCVAYEDRMDLFFAAADLVVCRAGAMTVSEVAATGTAAVFVPLEPVGQQHNAAALSSRGAARLLPQSDIGMLPYVTAELLSDDGARATMAAAAAAQGAPEAAGTIAARILEAARG